MYQFTRATLINYYRLGDLENRKLFSHSSRGYKSEISVLEKLIFFLKFLLV